MKRALKCKPSVQFERNIGTFELKTPLHALGEHTGMRTESHRTNIKIHGFIYDTYLVPAQVLVAVAYSKRLISNKNGIECIISIRQKELGNEAKLIILNRYLG